MSEGGRASGNQESGLTPWVGRLLVAHALGYLLLRTVFTAPLVGEQLQFVPGLLAERPWTLLSYMFPHSGLLHLGANLLFLSVLGPPVERRMGGRGFVLFYLYCGVGASALALGLTAMATVPPLVGATGAVLGVVLAFAMHSPEAEIGLFPLPLRVSARVLVLTLALAVFLFGLLGLPGAAHLAGLGGLASSYLFFRVQALREWMTRREAPAPPRRPVLTPLPVGPRRPATDLRPAATPRSDLHEEIAPDEVDRVLDKISALGIQSLTPEERRFLDEVSRRKRQDLH